jgi:hypothetical protein
VSGHRPEYPQYYILDIADIVETLANDWHNAIAKDISHEQCMEQDPMQQVYPEVYTVDAYGQMQKKVYTAQSYVERTKPWYPDVSFIIHHVIDCIKQRNDPSEDIDMALQLLEYDIAVMAHHQLMPNVPTHQLPQVYSDTRMRVAKIAATFGKQLFQRFVAFGLYKDGYFPYHFAGWQDTCALVELDSTHR